MRLEGELVDVDCNWLVQAGVAVGGGICTPELCLTSLGRQQGGRVVLQEGKVVVGSRGAVSSCGS